MSSSFFGEAMELLREFVKLSARFLRQSALLVSLFIVFCPPFFWPSVARADDALVLPKGRSSATLENLFYFPTGQRWNHHGNPEEVAGVFDNRRLDSTVFSLLSPLDRFVGGRATLGTAFARFSYDFNILDLGYAYGITDRLTAGIDIPYYHATNTVKAFLRSGPGTGANVGINTGTVTAITPTTAVLPLSSTLLAAGGVRRFTTEDVQQLLGPGLTVGRVRIPGFGFKRIQDFSADGLGDIVVGAKYQYLRTEDWRLAATGGVRFPTGRQDDPDNLTDVAWSSGAYALLLRLHNDYMVSNLWKGRPATGRGSSWIPQTGDLFLDFTFRYDWVLPDEATVRVASPSNPITTSRERVDRGLGDRFELEWTVKYFPFPGWSLSALYKYGFKLEDRITGRMGFPTQLLQEFTDSTEQIYIVRVTYSTLPLYMEKRFPIPLNVSIGYRDRFAGSGPSNAASPSQYLKTRYLSLGLEVLF